MKKSIIILLVAVLFISLVGCISTTTPAKPKTVDQIDEIDAFSMAEYYVKQYLKAPGSAKFQLPAEGANVVNLGNGEWHVVAYVDAQNSFGALLRNNYDCTVKYTGNDSWQLEKLAIDDEVYFPPHNPDLDLELIGGIEGTHDEIIDSVHYIIGSIKNNGSSKYSKIQITFVLKDKDKNKIGTANDVMFNLEDNETRQFKAIIFLYDESNLKYYELESITGN